MSTKKAPKKDRGQGHTTPTAGTTQTKQKKDRDTQHQQRRQQNKTRQDKAKRYKNAHEQSHEEIVIVKQLLVFAENSSGNVDRST